MHSAQEQPCVFISGLGIDASIAVPVLSKLLNTPSYHNLPDIDNDKDLDLFFTNILPKTPYHAIAYSLGALLLLKHLHKEIGSCLSVTALYSTPQFFKDPEWPGIDLSVLPNYIKSNNLKNDHHAHIKKFTQQFKKWVAYPNLKSLKEIPFLAISERSHAYYLHQIRTLSLRDTLPNLSIHWLLGSNDAIVPIQTTEYLTNSTVLQTGHGGLWTHPDALSEYIKMIFISLNKEKNQETVHVE